MVTQDSLLFAGTVADNIRFGRPEASQAEVEAAARLANAHEFIMGMTSGYDTRVLEGGAEPGASMEIGIRKPILYTFSADRVGCPSAASGAAKAPASDVTRKRRRSMWGR